MKDDYKIWHIIVTIITVGFSIYGVVTYLLDKEKNANSDSLHQRQIEQQITQRQKEEENSNNPQYQVTCNYKEFIRYQRLASEGKLGQLEKIQLNKAIGQLQEWIPKYRELLMQKQEKALSEGDTASFKSCEKELSELKEKEEKVFN